MDRLCLVSLGGDFLSESFTARHVGSQEKRKKKRNVGRRLVHELSSKELLLKVGSRLPGKWCLKRSPQRDEERTLG